MNEPKLRFHDENGGEYLEWQESSFGDLFEIKVGGDTDSAHISNTKSEKFQYPVYANAIENDGLYSYADYYTISGPSFTVAGRGVNIGHAVNRGNEKYVSIVRLLSCLPKHNESTGFFTEVINRIPILIESTGVPQLTAPQLQKIPVKYPSCNEQQKIADFLSTVDEKIALKQKKYDGLAEAKKGLLQKIFNREIRFRKDDGGEYPEWEDCAISEPCKKKSIDPRKFPNKLFSEYSMPAYDDNKTPYHKYGNEMDSSRIIVDKPSILMNKLNIRKKRIWNVQNPEKNAIASTEFVPVFPGCNIQGFIYQYLQSNIVTEELLSSSAGSSNSQKRVHPEDILTMVVPMPCFEEQQKIADFLSVFDEKIEIVRKELEGWKTIKKGLLQQMFC